MIISPVVLWDRFTKALSKVAGGSCCGIVPLLIGVSTAAGPVVHTSLLGRNRRIECMLPLHQISGVTTQSIDFVCLVNDTVLWLLYRTVESRRVCFHKHSVSSNQSCSISCLQG